ncbi:DNA alkylation repair protein, partial [Candidatus Woesebacteria bacterium RBG_16_39_8b]
KTIANPKNVDGMARFGINPKNTYGISIPNLRKIAKEIGNNHDMAQKLWASGYHEAKILASMIDEADKVTEKQMDAWVSDFDSWDVCDQVCSLFEKTPYAFEKVVEWSKKNEEFVKRAGFALMATIAWHDKDAPDSKFVKFFPHIKKGSTDERNYVKKAVNWALRNIGKRNKTLNKRAIQVAKEIQSANRRTNSKSARWIAADAIRELTGEKVQKRLLIRSTK